MRSAADLRSENIELFVPAPVLAALPFRRVINTAIQIIRLPYSSRSVIILIGDLGHNPI